MNEKIFKKLSIDNCFINLHQFTIIDQVIPALSVIYCDKSTDTVYICTHIPNYTGRPENVILNVLWYDRAAHMVGADTFKNDISCAMFTAWQLAYKPRTRKPVYVPSDADYKRMMNHDRRKKSGTGGVRLSSKSDQYMTDGLRYKQVTESAYWSNLFNAKSGNASVVAASIK